MTGWLTWSCLLLSTVGAAPDDIFHMNQKSFQIPIKLDPKRQPDVRELVLYMSTDQGRTWKIQARAFPDKKAFDIVCDSDGERWFSIAVVDSRGQDPPDPYRAAVGQKVFVDTVKPEVRIASAEWAGDEVAVRWEVREQHPDWPTLRLEYRVGEPSGQWVPLPIVPGPHGNLKFKPGLPGDVTLRLSLKDRATNEGVEEKVIAGRAGMVDRHVVGAGATEGPQGGPPAVVPPPGGTSGAIPGGPVPGTTTAFSPAAPAAPAVTRASGSDGTPMPPAAGGAPAPLPHSTTAPGAIQGGVGGSPGTQGLGSAGVGASVASAGVGVPGAGRVGALPPLKIVNKQQQKLEFEVAEYGPSGLGSVDVYVSTDEGATWELAPPDSHNALSVGDLKGAGPVVGTVTVPLPKDGVTYGFYLVVKSRAGLGGPAPRPGDAPQVRIERDTTLPVASLFAPQADPGRKDTLVLAWQAEDRNLAANPVTLEWAAKPEGPWEFIGEPQLPNTGRYSWQVPPKMPAKVYLRLTVRDTASNTAVAQTPEPVLIDVFIPRVTAVRASR